MAVYVVLTVRQYLSCSSALVHAAMWSSTCAVLHVFITPFHVFTVTPAVHAVHTDKDMHAQCTSMHICLAEQQTHVSNTVTAKWSPMKSFKLQSEGNLFA